MKFLIILSLCYCSSIHAEKSIIIEVTNVTGEFSVGEIPQRLSGPDPDDEIETESLKLVLNLARRMAKVGVHQLPPFDPWVGDSINTVDIEGLKELEGKVDVSDVVVTGMKNYDFSNVAVQSSNLSMPGSKLIQYDVSFPSLNIEGSVKATVSVGGGKPEVITAKISASAEGIVREVSIGLLPLVKKYDLDSSYATIGMKVNSEFEEIKIKLTNVKTVSARSRAIIRKTRDTDLIANIVTALSSSAVKKQLDKILLGMTTKQLDDFLLPKPW